MVGVVGSDTVAPSAEAAKVAVEPKKRATTFAFLTFE